MIFLTKHMLCYTLAQTQMRRNPILPLQQTLTTTRLYNPISLFYLNINLYDPIQTKPSTPRTHSATPLPQRLVVPGGASSPPASRPQSQGHVEEATQNACIQGLKLKARDSWFRAEGVYLSDPSRPEYLKPHSM